MQICGKCTFLFLNSIHGGNQILRTIVSWVLGPEKVCKKLFFMTSSEGFTWGAMEAWLAGPSDAPLVRPAPGQLQSSEFYYFNI